MIVIKYPNSDEHTYRNSIISIKVEDDQLKKHLYNQIVSIYEKILILELDFEKIISLKDMKTLSIELDWFKINLNNMVNVVNNIQSLSNNIRQRFYSGRNKTHHIKNYEEFIEYLGAKNTLELIKQKLITIDKRSEEIIKLITKTYRDKSIERDLECADIFNKLEGLVMENETNVDLGEIEIGNIEFQNLLGTKLESFDNYWNHHSIIQSSGHNSNNRNNMNILPNLSKISSISPLQIYDDKKQEYGSEINNIYLKYKNTIMPRINNLQKLIATETDMLNTLLKFDPEFPIFIPRLAELMDKDTDSTIELLKFTLARNSDLGVYNDMAQVFKPSNKMDIEIDKLMKQFNKMSNK